MHASKQDNASHKSDCSQTTLMEAVCSVASMVQQQTVGFMQFAEATQHQTAVMIEQFSRQALTPVSQPSSISQIDVLRDIWNVLQTIHVVKQTCYTSILTEKHETSIVRLMNLDMG